MFAVSQERSWTDDTLKVSCKRWFSLLLKAVEIKEGVENILESFLESSMAVTLHRDYKPYIKDEVRMKMFHIPSANF